MYVFQVFGHVGECRSAIQFDHYNSQSPNSGGLPTTRPVRDPKAAASASGDTAASVSAAEVKAPVSGCVIEGEVNTTDLWHGFIANVSIKSGGRIVYQISFPVELHHLYFMLYVEEDLPKLGHAKECWDKHGVIESPNVHAQVHDCCCTTR